MLDERIKQKLRAAHPWLEYGKIPSYFSGREGLTAEEMAMVLAAYLAHPELRQVGQKGLFVIEMCTSTVTKARLFSS